MRKLIILIFFTASLFAQGELEQAYAKEYAFLKAQKEMLKKRLKEVERHDKQMIQKAKEDLAKLQNRVIANDLLISELTDKLYKLQQSMETIQSDDEIIDSIILQASSLLQSYDKNITIDPEDKNATLYRLFDTTLELIDELQRVRKSKGSFYLKDGSETNATIIHVGNIAKYGVSPTIAGALAPAGAGKFKIWETEKSAADAKAFANGQNPEELHIFIYENPNKEVEEEKEKTVLDVIESGGIIGWVIVGLGIFGLLLVIARIFFLLKANNNAQKLASKVVELLNSEGKEAALAFLKGKKGPVARVLKAVVRNIDKDKEHVEDIIMEALINESERLDKYGTAIIVIAAVSPLLGLLGTVTGMIETFDIITKFGTGDPKMLSSGISVALVTTELGLVVAIPLLLFGNLLNGWAEKIKDDIEASALHVLNQYRK